MKIITPKEIVVNKVRIDEIEIGGEEHFRLIIKLKNEL